MSETRTSSSTIIVVALSVFFGGLIGIFGTVLINWAFTPSVKATDSPIIRKTTKEADEKTIFLPEMPAKTEFLKPVAKGKQGSGKVNVRSAPLIHLLYQYRGIIDRRARGNYYYDFRGSVKNVSGKTLTRLRVTAYFYSGIGLKTFEHSRSAPVDPSTLSPGQLGSFLVQTYNSAGEPGLSAKKVMFYSGDTPLGYREFREARGLE